MEGRCGSHSLFATSYSPFASYEEEAQSGETAPLGVAGSFWGPPGRLCRRGNARGRRGTRSLLERQDRVGDLLAVARLLHVGDLAAPAVRNPCLGDLARGDRIVGVDVLRPDDAGDDQVAHLE